MVPVCAKLNECWPLRPLGVIFHTTDEDLVVWKRTPRGLRGQHSVSLAQTGTMGLLFNCGTIVPKTYSR